MKTVYLCGSFKYIDKMKSIQETFISYEIHCTKPELDSPKGIQGCLEQISKADITFVVNPDGYIGKSVSVDIGYALALNKKVYSLVPIDDPPVGGLISGVATIEDVIKIST